MILLIELALHFPLYSATLIPLKVKCEQGQKEIFLPIDLKTEPSEHISGIQFDIVIPAGTKITNMKIAESAQRANKMVSYNQIKANTYRTIVAGLNQQSIGEGTILFVTITIEDKVPAGKQIIKLLNTVLADPEGNSINCTVLPGEILFPGDESLQETQSQSSPQLPIEKKGFFNPKNIGIILLLIIGVLVSAGIIIKQIIKTKKTDLGNKKQSKKRKK